jgi:phospholipid/cholesterol/gamma-HCH transport system permease protein
MATDSNIESDISSGADKEAAGMDSSSKVDKFLSPANFSMLSSISNPFLSVCKGLGAAVLRFFEAAGRLIVFMAQSIIYVFIPPFFPRLIGRQLIDIGYYSLPVVGLTALFTGMVLALQSYTGFTRFNAEGAVAGVVVLSVTRELAPVLAGLMVAGRVGAAIAAEIATMRVTEQIDAMVTLSVNPFKYLIAPRIVAGTLMLPILVFVGDIIGVFGGYIVSIYSLGFNPGNYLHQTYDILERIDVISGLIKASAFGLIIALMGCYHGFHSKRGAQGVGTATTNAVVSASILILIFNFILTQMFFS